VIVVTAAAIQETVVTVAGGNLITAQCHARKEKDHGKNLKPVTRSSSIPDPAAQDPSLARHGCRHRKEVLVCLGSAVASQFWIMTRKVKIEAGGFRRHIECSSSKWKAVHIRWFYSLMRSRSFKWQSPQGMKSTKGGDDSVHVFIAKLYCMLQDVRCSPCIFWSRSGKTLVIPDQERFSRQALPW
jgi:hypothetical protein